MAANSTAPLPPADDDQGPMLLASSLPLYAVALLCFAARFGSRLRTRFRPTAADWACAVAVAFKSVAIGFTVASVGLGFGRHAAYVADRARLVRYHLAIFLAGTGASAFSRISIALLLLQFTASRAWRAVLWGTVVLNALDFAVYWVVQFASCSTMLSLKVVKSGTQCLTPQHVWGFTYAAITVAMISDLSCAIIPALVIRRLPRSTVERAVITILMSSCLLASGCGIAKLYYMVVFDFSNPDALYAMVPEFFWSRMEEAIVIVAACVPLLKSPVERLVGRLRRGRRGGPADTERTSVRLPEPGMARRARGEAEESKETTGNTVESVGTLSSGSDAGEARTPSVLAEESRAERDSERGSQGNPERDAVTVPKQPSQL